MTRQRIALAILAIGLPVLTLILTSIRGSIGLADALLIYLLFAVIVSAVGGPLPAMVGTFAAFLVLDYYFVPPFHHFNISGQVNAVSLLIFAAVAAIVSVTVEVATRRGAIIQSNTLKTSLLSAVSHDFRTPLASIRAATDTLTNSQSNLSEAQTALLLDAVGHETQRLETLVSDVLDMSRLRSEVVTVAVEPLGIETVVTSLLEEFANADEQVQLDIPDDVPTFIADPPLLQRALVNLVQNALKYRGEQTVRVVARSVDNQVQIQVVDHGPGIEPKLRAQAFQPFKRLNAETDPPGIGLGLSVAKGFVEAMGGNLLVSETLGGGTTMSVLLPQVVR